MFAKTCTLRISHRSIDGSFFTPVSYFVEYIFTRVPIFSVVPSHHHTAGRWHRTRILGEFDVWRRGRGKLPQNRLRILGDA